MGVQDWADWCLTLKLSRRGSVLCVAYEMAVGEDGGGCDRAGDSEKRQAWRTRLCVRKGEGRWYISAETKPPGLGFASWVRNGAEREWRGVRSRGDGIKE